MLLPADNQLSVDLTRGRLVSSKRITCAQAERLFKKTVCLNRLINGQHSWQRGDIHTHQLSGISGLGPAVGHHGKQGLAMIHHLIFSKDRIIPHHRAAVIFTRNIRRAQNSMNTGRRQRLFCIYAVHPAMGNIAQPQRDMHTVCRQRHIINISGPPGDMQRRAFMGQRGADLGVVFRSAHHWPCCKAGGISSASVSPVPASRTEVSVAASRRHF